MFSFRRLLIVVLLLICSTVFADKQVHQHSVLEIPADAPVPRIEIQVERDPMDGLNVLLKIEDYLMNSPLDQLETPPVLQGHAHVFINGKKMQRLYGNAMHVPKAWFREGVNQIAVSLNSHNHDNWTKDGKMIVGSVFVDLSKEELVLHHFTSQPLENAHSGHH